MGESQAILAPALPESVADATVLAWRKQVGEPVQADELLVELETDKVVLEVYAPAAGMLVEIAQPAGAVVQAGQILGRITVDAKSLVQAKPAPAPPVAEPPAAPAYNVPASPSVRKLLAEHGLSGSDVHGSGKQGRILKEDVLAAVQQAAPAAPKSAEVPASAAVVTPPPAAAPAALAMAEPPTGERASRRVPVSRIRARIAERLLQAKQGTAMLTTFNEVDMQAIQTIRNRYKDAFAQRHGVKLGFMSWFVKATCVALQRFPEVNAYWEDDSIVYHDYCDIGIAVSSERGLVVPVVRNAETFSLAQLEAAIAEFATKARTGKLALDELAGGTFTITNGGVFGSLLSTPLLNPPQSAILGMHAIQERPVAVAGQVVVRPMMYVALSYDHRIVDGQGAVSFLKAIKELLEDPVRLLLDI